MSKLSHSNPNLDDVLHEGNEADALKPEWLRVANLLESVENNLGKAGMTEDAVKLIDVRRYIQKQVLAKDWT